MLVRIEVPAILPPHLNDLDDEYDISTYTDVEVADHMIPTIGDTLIVDDGRAVTVTRRIWPGGRLEVDLVLHTTPGP